MAMFYISIYIIALGNGGYEPSLATFGSDQFDEGNSSNQSFYSYFYVAANIGSLFSETVLAYVQNMGAWALGFWVSTASAVVALLVFFTGSMRYKNFKPCGNPISRFCQVVVAAWRKSALEIPPHGDGELYHGVLGNGRTATSLGGGRKILHTKGFRFLDHAAIITSDDKVEGGSQNPWRLCTITQIEEVKCVLRLLPVWLCTITFSGIFVQTASLFVEQGAAMNTVINNFHVPPASMTIFDIVSVCSIIIFYDKLILPLYTKLISNTVLPTSPSDLKKMGLGLVVAIAAMLTAGFVEIQRRSNAVDGGDELSSLCLLWQIPQYVLLGVAEAFVYVAQFDFFGSKAPHGLKSLGIGLCMASTSIGSYLCSLVLAVVMEITTKGGRPGWIPANLNEGHLERFFFLMAALTAVELAVYIWFAGRYKCISLEREEEE
ncbi:protein NRT1/ PTR FAMILY 7.3-like [Typha latifolia]|uniref:protein NRT1/ PTR FAMILY 7.3-like n=1 Tax=Typha latifolia TaxID=4733 RepID=UPI003C2E6EF3